jgi:mRNA-degrading endonuclease RelE of RelBE toxin-antitoxin system
MREILFGSYRVIYEVGDSVRILTVRHCKAQPDHGELGLSHP